MIVLGNKVNDVGDRYFDNGKKRPLIADLLRIVESENAKRKKKSAAEKRKEKEAKKKAEAETQKAMVDIRKEKKKQKKAPPPEAVRPKINFGIGDQVRLFDGKAVGTIDAIEKRKAIVNYGAFTTQVNLEALDLVQTAKKEKVKPLIVFLMGRVYSATDGCNGFVVTIIPTGCALPTLNTLPTKILRYCGAFPPPLQTQSLSGIRKWLTTPKLQLFSNFLKLWEEPGRSLPFSFFTHRSHQRYLSCGGQQSVPLVWPNGSLPSPTRGIQTQVFIIFLYFVEH